MKHQEQELEEQTFMQERHQIEIEEEKRKETTEVEIRGRIAYSTTTGEMDTQKVAKLLKLSITKLTGTHLDWLHFWGQFESEIHKANLTPVTKFSYLKELVIPSVCVIIDGLPFNSKGCEQTKNIVFAKYGQNSEIVAARVKCIMNFPVINRSNRAKVSEFYQQLVTHIQALQTMGKLRNQWS